jgi:hypothetical protein
MEGIGVSIRKVVSVFSLAGASNGNSGKKGFWWDSNELMLKRKEYEKEEP